MTRSRRQERGLGLVELMVATVLSLVVVAGVAAVYAGLKTSWAAQDELADMQDSERLALSLLTQLVRHAGFNPDPLGMPAAAALPPETQPQFGDLAAGQALMGTAGAGGAPDTLTVRLLADGSGVARDCLGSGNRPAGTLVTNRITVDGKGQLTCRVGNAPPQPLLDGLAGFAVLYGVDTFANCSPCQPRRYMDATQVSAAGAWARVRVLRLSLRFTVPRGSPAWVQWDQVIAVMNP